LVAALERWYEYGNPKEPASNVAFERACDASTGLATRLKQLNVAAQRIGNNVLVGELNIVLPCTAVDAFADRRKLLALEIFLDHSSY